MIEKYDFAEIEKKWQKKWKDADIFKTTEDESKEKYYVLEMFPYRPENYIWGMCGTIPSVMSLPDLKP